MGRLTMTEEEYNYNVDNIREAFDLIGQKAVLFQVDTQVTDIYHDSVATYKDGRDISLIFEDNPKPILKKYNWITEDEELPIVCHIVAMDNDGNPLEIEENMRILLKSQFGIRTERLYSVSRVTGSSVDPLTFICKLVPYRAKIDMDEEKEGYQSSKNNERNEQGFSYLKGEI